MRSVNKLITVGTRCRPRTAGWVYFRSADPVAIEDRLAVTEVLHKSGKITTKPAWSRWRLASLMTL